MKRWKGIVILCAVIMASAFCCLLLFPDGEERAGKTPVEAGRIETVLSDETQDNGQEPLSKLLLEFADTIYEYDTTERRYYEGAEAYMTNEAFRMLAPEAGEESTVPEFLKVHSKLLGMKCYYCYEDDTCAEVIMESRFTLSKGGNGSLTQYLKLSVQKQEDGWIITGCQTVDTLEE